MKKIKKGRAVFSVVNYMFLSLLALLCILPLLTILAMSFSSATAVAAGKVTLWPVEFTTMAYQYVIEKKEFWTSLLKSVERVLIGVPLSMIRFTFCYFHIFQLSLTLLLIRPSCLLQNISAQKDR